MAGPLPQSLILALQRSLSLAPSSLFPRARRLYFDKYPLEGAPQELDAASSPRPFRSFVLQETTSQDEQGQRTTQVHDLALVHWHAPQASAEDYLAYLQSQWQLDPISLTLEEQAWFRDGGAWARIKLPGAGPVPPEGVPASSG